jgi:hypothetical protein
MTLAVRPLVLAGMLFVGCRQRAPFDPAHFSNDHPDIDQCRQAASLSTIASWDGVPIRVGYAASANKPCPAPGFPFVSVNAEGKYRWIQIVELNVTTPADGHSLDAKPFPWTFVDMEERLRPLGQPFVNGSTDGSFWDNPAWAAVPPPDQADGMRRWRARTYLVDVGGKTIRAHGGITWGWSWRVGDVEPEGSKPMPLHDEWKADRILLNAAFPDWNFE